MRAHQRRAISAVDQQRSSDEADEQEEEERLYRNNHGSGSSGPSRTRSGISDHNSRRVRQRSHAQNEVERHEDIIKECSRSSTDMSSTSLSTDNSDRIFSIEASYHTFSFSVFKCFGFEPSFHMNGICRS